MTQPRSSLDGFIPSNQGRHVGFGQPQGARLGGNARIRLRRPGLHNPPVRSSQPAIVTRPSSNFNGFTDGRPMAAPTRQGSRAALPGLTTYNASRSTETIANDGALGGRDRGRDSDRQKNSGTPGDQDGRRRGRRRRRGSANNSNKTAKTGSFWRRTNWKKVFKRTSLVLVALIVLAGGWFGWKIARTTAKVFGGNSSVLDFLQTTKLNGEDQGRVNILLAGVSSDDPGHEGADLTDSFMLISLDTKNHKAFMLSVPRDLWVSIPGYGHSKINAANAYGDNDDFSQPGYPAGGMGLLEQVIAQDFQTPIHYYAKINYTAFRDAVNAVGGITVNIQSSDKRGLYDPNISKADQGPLKLPNGVQTLNGQTALNLARARGDPPGDGRVPYGFENNDFSRTEHQRQMLLALKDKITSGSVITNPLKINDLFDTIGKNMKTDLKPSEVRRLYDLGKQTKSNDIESLSLNDAGGVNLLASYRSPDGASALAPAAGVDNFAQIQLYLKKVMSSDPVVKESAKIVILNGGDTTGLASKMSNVATSKGLNVVAVDDAPHVEGANIIIDQTTKAADGSSGKPATLARLKQVFGSNSGSTSPGNVGYPTADFVIVLGTNQKAPASTSNN